MHSKAIVWFRRDLRIQDQRALFESLAQAKSVLPVFIIDETITQKLPKDDRRITFIQHSLTELNQEFAKHGSELLILAGDPSVLIPELANDFKVNAVFCNHDYEPYAKNRDAKVAKQLSKSGIQFHSFKDQVVFEKQEILNLSGGPYKVFTPYSRAWIKKLESNRNQFLASYDGNLKHLMPATEIHAQQKWKMTNFFEHGFLPQKLWIPAGEKEANRSIKKFKDSILNYHETRDFPAIDGTSVLSPHFRFGTLSIREAVRFCYQNYSAGTKIWLNELIWRDFYQMILDQFPHVVGHAFKPEYDSLKWSGKEEHFQAWCEGRTGYPLVDAAMRQLNETGWMHNRLRMITAMFLTKDLLVDWRKGEAYFALKLLDFDLASNNGGWQWSASTGCDAQPYFRIMNPISQSEKFDEAGSFIKKFVPELSKVKGKAIHWPHDDGLFTAPDYPAPIVDHKTQRELALKMFKK